MVSVEAPPEVTLGSTFKAKVNISNVTDFDACDYEVVFDPSVLELTAVTNGEIDGTAIPIVATSQISAGRWKMVENIPAIPGVSGSGYLAELHFHVVGSSGNSSTISLQKGTLSDKAATEIKASWSGAVVHVQGAGPLRVLRMPLRLLSGWRLGPAAALVAALIAAAILLWRRGGLRW